MKKKTFFRGIRFVALILVMAILAAACGAANSDPSTSSGQETVSQPTQTQPESTATETTPTQPAETEPAQTEPPETTPPETEPPETEPTVPDDDGVKEITLTFVGDCTFGRNQKASYYNSFDEMYDNKGANYFFKKVRDIFKNDDITVINLEGSLTTSDDIQEKLWNHKGDPEYVKIMTGSSVEVATMGNNHRLDYGESGCVETVEVLENAGITYCYDDIYAVYEVKGVKVGFVSVNEVYDGWHVEKWLKEGYQQLRDQGCAIVVACIHWGGDKTPVIEDYQIQLGHKAIDWGYDLVVGNHPHVLQAMEVYKGRFICYSLGNFCYGGNKNPADKDSGIFQQTFTVADGALVRDTNTKFIPCSLSGVTTRNDYQPTPSKGSEFQRIIEKMNGYSAEFGFALDSQGRPARMEGKVAAGHTHNYTSTVTAPTCTAQGYTLKTCICGESVKSDYTQATGHQYGTYTSNNDATCTKDGTKTAVCKTCGAKKNMTDPGTARGHSYSVSVVAPTCETDGYTLHQCSGCGDSYTDSPTNAAGHTWGDWVITSEPTTAAEGTESRTCGVCGKTESRGVDKLENSGEYSVLSKEVLDLINGYRAAEDLEPLEWYTTGEDWVKTRAYELTIEFTQGRPDGSDGLGEHFNSDCRYSGSNSAAATVDAWMESNEQRMTLMSADWTYAVAAYNNGYWIVMLGSEA